MYIYVPVSFVVIAMNFGDRCKITGLCKVSHRIKQPSNSVYLKKAMGMH